MAPPIIWCEIFVWQHSVNKIATYAKNP